MQGAVVSRPGGDTYADEVFPVCRGFAPAKALRCPYRRGFAPRSRREWALCASKRSGAHPILDDRKRTAGTALPTARYTRIDVAHVRGRATAAALATGGRGYSTACS